MAAVAKHERRYQEMVAAAERATALQADMPHLEVRQGSDGVAH